MPATFEPIATTTLGSAASSITFSSIPGTYTDLRVVIVCKTVSTNSWLGMRFNSDSGTNYGNTYLIGTGSSAISGRYASQDYFYVAAEQLSSSQNGFVDIDIFSYGGSTNKTVLSSFNLDYNGSGVVGKFVGVWLSTSAISSITLAPVVPSGSFATGTTATLYGILKA